MNYPISIPKAIEACVDKVRTAKLAALQGYDPTIETISFMYGNINGIIEELQQKTNDSTAKTQKFPVIILLEDISVIRKGTGYFGKTRGMEIIIANHTLPDYSSAQREDINFTNILRPLYYNLLYQMANSKDFGITSEVEIDHEMIERKYWGADDYTKSKLGDYIDAIHMANIEIPIRYEWRTSLTGISTG